MKTKLLQTRIILILAMAFFLNIGNAQQNKYYGNSQVAPNFGPSESGEVLFNQMTNVSTGFMVSHHFTSGNKSETCSAADDFIIPVGETWNVGSIGIAGTYWQNEPGGGDTLNVHIMADNNGLPGDTLHEYLEFTNFVKTEEDNGLGYINTYFEIILPSTVTLTEGTYWVAVQMVSDIDITGQWGWSDHSYESAITGAEWHWINPKDGWELGAINWTPANILVGPWLLWELSFAIFGEAPATDLAVLSITSPDDYFYGPPTELQNVTAIFKNEGLEPQTGFDINYILDGNEVTENIGSISLGFNETYEFTFTQKIDISSPGSYDLEVYTMLDDDENPSNDSKSIEITVFDPTVYAMTNLAVGYDSTCSGTFADAEGLGGNLGVNDWGIHTFYPTSSGAKIRLEFAQFDIGWSDFWIYDGENVDAPELGWWEDTLSPGTLTASNENVSGALTIQFVSQGWTPFEKPGWAANIECFTPSDDDFAVIDIDLSSYAVFEYDYVSVYAHIKNVGTAALDKDVTFSANGVDYATVSSGLVEPDDTVLVEAIWLPNLEGDYELIASVPDDLGQDDNNSFSIMQNVFPYTYFYEGFDGPLFPPDGWSQSSNLWVKSDFWILEGTGGAYFEGLGTLVDTLRTPKLVIEAGDKIQFSAYSSAWWPGRLDLVWIDVETGESELIQEINLPFMWYQTFEIDVTAGEGNNYLGFVGKGAADGSYGRVELDEVYGIGIEKFFYNNDLKAYKLTGDNVPTVNESAFFNIDVKNLGLDVISGSDYTVKLMQEPGIELASFNGVDINPKQVIDFTLDHTFDFSGEKHLYAIVDFTNDEDQSNNISIPLVIFVQQEGTIQIPIGMGTGEEFFYPYATSGGSDSYSQTLFFAEDIGEPMTITGVMYYYISGENYPIYDYPVSIWFQETDLTNMNDSIFTPVTNMYKTFEGGIDLYPGENGVYIPLDFPYPYTGQNLMVTGFKDNNLSYTYGSWYWKTTQAPDVMTRYITDAGNVDMIPEDSLNLNSYYPHLENAFSNIKFFKVDLTGQYCIPQTVYGTNNGDFVDGVTFNDIENLGTGSLGGPAYQNFTSITTPVEIGRYYELNVQAESSGTNGSIAVWIDFNQDKDFDDEGEMVMHMIGSEGSQTATTLVKIPDNAAPGITLMRIRNSSEPDIFTGCGAVDYGETEDYSVNLLQTEQIYYPAPEFDVALLNEGNVEINWELPQNPGQSIVEGFEMSTWPPEGWEVKNSETIDGTLVDPTDDTWMKFGDNFEYIYNGAFSAICVDSAPDFNWLISPHFQVYSNDDMSFMLNYSSDEMGYSKFYVMAEMDGEWTVMYELTDEVVYYNNYNEAVNIALTGLAGKSIRVAFVTDYNDAYPVAIDDVVIKGVASGSKSVEGITGYNIYRNSELFAEISDPSILSTTDLLDATENFIYCIEVTYAGGVSESLCDEIFYLLPLTAPINVRAKADNDDVTVNWVAPSQGMMRFSDDFENYSLGQQVACQNPDDWTTWTQEPCSGNDPFITTEYAYSGEQSVENTGASDLLYKTDEILTAGKYSVNFMLYIPDLRNAYFNVLQVHDLSTGSQWGFQAFFDQGGEGTIDADGYSTAIFDFDYNEWMYVEVIADMDNNWGEFRINDELIYEWPWSNGIGGANEQNTLNGIDFYSWSANAPAEFYVDDFQLVQLYDNENELSYNIYRNDNLVGTSSITTFEEADLEAGSHTYCVSAIYDEGESDTDCASVAIITAPENFTAAVQEMNNVYCEWEAIASSNLSGYQVYRDGMLVSGLLTNTNWTDQELEAGSFSYYVTAIYDDAESLPSNEETVIVLLSPQNLVAAANADGDIELNWDPVGDVLIGEMVELWQHDGVPVNGVYEFFNNGYGVVYDLSAYPGATIEMADFHHGSWGVTGTDWFYKMHIVDWTTATSIAEFGPFTTTGDDLWETEIPLGSVEATSNLIGIFMEPMSYLPDNAYPILSLDDELNGNSIRVYLNDLTAWIDEPGDFLLDLWIFAPDENKMVNPISVNVNNNNIENSRKPYKAVEGEIIVDQKSKGANALLGYNVYYAYDSEPFSVLDVAYDTTYTHEGGGTISGLHNYYVTATFDEGESEASNIATEFIDGVSENELSILQFYPNPVTDFLNLTTGFNIESLELINSKGQVIYEEHDIHSTSIKLNMENQPAGIYNIRLQSENGWLNQKVIKK